ncbi:hypothetical protein HW555_000512 [Spodoptera exigua]|uniref:Uncharacterized protein n=1 Tax=Spodoptera exigua TaxID=7107 RepID=A0A835L8U7_SPOEX|nr:hypothetical protein HW555_000512 [Spodoptera exigua]
MNSVPTCNDVAVNDVNHGSVPVRVCHVQCAHDAIHRLLNDAYKIPKNGLKHWRVIIVIVSASHLLKRDSACVRKSRLTTTLIDVELNKWWSGVGPGCCTAPAVPSRACDAERSPPPAPPPAPPVLCARPCCRDATLVPILLALFSFTQ